MGALSVLAFGVFIYTITVGAANQKWQVLMAHVLVSACIPVVVIYNHQGIKATAKKTLKSFIPEMPT